MNADERIAAQLDIQHEDRLHPHIVRPADTVRRYRSDHINRPTVEAHLLPKLNHIGQAIDGRLLGHDDAPQLAHLLMIVALLRRHLAMSREIEHLVWIQAEDISELPAIRGVRKRSPAYPVADR